MRRARKFIVEDPTTLTNDQVQHIIRTTSDFGSESAVRKVYDLGKYVLKVDFMAHNVQRYGGAAAEVGLWLNATDELRQWLCPIVAYHLNGRDTGSWVVMPKCRVAHNNDNEAVYKKYREAESKLKDVLELHRIQDQHHQNMMSLACDKGRRLVSVDYANVRT